MSDNKMLELPQIDTRLNDLKSAANDLENLLFDLANRLRPVMTPITLAGEVASDATKAPEQSPVATQIDLVTSSLQQQANAIRYLIRNLEI